MVDASTSLFITRVSSVREDFYHVFAIDSLHFGHSGSKKSRVAHA